jgi:microcystin-dependent protein
MTVPTGIVIAWASNTTSPASGYLLCIGTSYNKNTYSNLFDVIGYNYGGSGDNFFVPDLRDCRPLMTSSTVGGSGGANTVTLDSTNLASHNHGVSTCSLSAHTHPVVTITPIAVGWAVSNNARLSGGNGKSVNSITKGNDMTTTVGSNININGSTGNPTGTPGAPFSVVNPFINMYYYIKT